jgi:hypothetical protein
VQGALVAAAVIAGRQLSQEWNERSLVCLTPVDNRPLLHLPDQPGLLFSGHVDVIAPSAELLFWDLAEATSQGLANRRSLEEAREAVGRTREYLMREVSEHSLGQMLSDTAGLDLMITNMGNIDFDQSQDFTVEELWFSTAAAKHTTQTIAAATVKGRLFLTHTSLEPIPMLLATMHEVLREATRHHRNSS